MTPRQVIFAPEARSDLDAIYNWIAGQGFERNSLAFVERIERYCRSFDVASQRGRRLNKDLRDFRVIGFERRATIVFEVQAQTVVILRIFRAGRDWRADLLASR
jgi:toxin ParE1/3/4